MSTNRRGFIGRIAVALAAPIIPVAAPAFPILKTVYDEEKVNALIDSWKAGSFNRAQPTAQGGEMTKEFVGRGFTRPVFIYEEDIILDHWKAPAVRIPEALLR